MKVAVTGASGFVGNRVVERFFLGGTHDTVPVVHSYSSLALPGRFDISWRVADHFSPKELSQAFTGCECVVHAAFGSPLKVMSRAVYRAANDAGVRRLVVLSSASVYNQNVAPGTTEESPLPKFAATAYNANKIAADRAMWDLRAKGRTEIVFLMPSVVFGPRSQWIAGIADQFLQGSAYLINDGNGICNSIYIDNLVDAIRLALDAPGVDGEAFFVSDAETVTWARLYRAILDAFGGTVEDLHRLDDLTLPEESSRQRLQVRLQDIVESPMLKRAKPYIPSLLMAAYKTLLVRPLAERTSSPNIWEPAVETGPAVVRDLALLQLCTYKLPNQKAMRLLGYSPVVPFDEGMRRSLGWLGFAGYPLTSDTPSLSISQSAVER